MLADLPELSSLVDEGLRVLLNGTNWDSSFSKKLRDSKNLTHLQPATTTGIKAERYVIICIKSNT